MGGEIVLIMLAVLIVMILLGIHIGVALALCSGVGVYIMFRGNTEAALSIMSNTAYEAVISIVFATALCAVCRGVLPLPPLRGTRFLRR